MSKEYEPRYSGLDEIAARREKRRNEMTLRNAARIAFGDVADLETGEPLADVIPIRPDLKPPTDLPKGVA